MSGSHTHNGFTTTPADKPYHNTGSATVVGRGPVHNIYNTQPRDRQPAHKLPIPPTVGTHLNIPTETAHNAIPHTAATHGAKVHSDVHSTPAMIQVRGAGVISNVCCEVAPLDHSLHLAHNQESSYTLLGLDAEIHQQTEKSNIQSLGDIDVRLESLHE